MKTKIIIRILFISILCVSFTSVNAQHHNHKKAQLDNYKKTQKRDPHHRYAKLPRWGRSYKAAPQKASIIAHSGVKYHYHSGIFYKPVGANYKIVKAPVGIRVRTLPKGKIQFVYGGKKYFYYYGTYYVKAVDDNEYITVAPLIGVRVDALPDGYKKVENKGNTYYEFEGTYYMAKILENNEVWYEVVDEI